ncbi:cya1 [Symbiodinium sp. CCMP2592]|nr:cya1 [Symbiodinium sp. CCMP2592]
MMHQMQDISALFAVTHISEFTEWPSLATDVNLAAITAFPSANEIRLDRIIQLYWDGITHRFPHVDYLAYGDRTGTFIGIERLPTHFTDKYPGSSVFGGEFRPSDLVGTSRQSCSTCPPPSVLVQGEKAYYFVNDSSGAFRNRYDSKVYDPRTRPWYTLGAEAKGQQAWTDIYSYSSGHTLGMSCSQAIMFEGEVLAVVSADFTVSFLSRFLREVTGAVPEQEGFVLDRDGFLVASSLGVEAVVRKDVDEGASNRIRYHWSQLPHCSGLLSPLGRYLSSGKVVGLQTCRLLGSDGPAAVRTMRASTRHNLKQQQYLMQKPVRCWNRLVSSIWNLLYGTPLQLTVMLVPSGTLLKSHGSLEHLRPICHRAVWLWKSSVSTEEDGGCWMRRLGSRWRDAFQPVLRFPS